ncbi:hypothetical protein [Persicobacter diffluens]
MMRCFLLLISIVVSCYPVAKANAFKFAGETFRFELLEEEQQWALEKSLKKRHESLKENGVPQEFTIPNKMIFYRESGEGHCYALKNRNYPFSVGMVPSDLVQLYEEEAWRAYQQYGKDAPPLSVVLAMHYTESAFNPKSLGDRGNSIGLGQLYKPTARILLQQDKAFWSKYFYFDRKGQHHFRSVRDMVRFTFDFLKLEKEYGADNKFEGIRAYNGIGEHAEKYARKVIMRSLVYERFFAQYHQRQIDLGSFTLKLNQMLVHQVLHYFGQGISPTEFNALFNVCMEQIKGSFLFPSYYPPQPFSNQESAMQVDFQSVHNLSGESHKAFLMVEDGQCVFSYFKNASVLLEVINKEDNGGFYCYDFWQGKRKILFDQEDLVDDTFYSNVIPGDFLFIPKGTLVYAPREQITLLVR